MGHHAGEKVLSEKAVFEGRSSNLGERIKQ